MTDIEPKISRRCSRRRSSRSAFERGQTDRRHASSPSARMSRSSTSAARAKRTIDIAELKDDDGDLEVAVGDRIQATVSRPPAAQLSRKLARGAATARQLEDAFHAGLPVEGKVEAGGQGRLRGPHRRPARVLPVLADRHRRARGSAQSTSARSTRSASSSTRTAARPRRLAPRAARGRAARAAPTKSASRSSPAPCSTGRVVSVRDFGAFVDLGGGVQGLLHVSEMGWSRVADPGEIVTARRGDHRQGAAGRRGDKQKISLGLKQLRPTPGRPSRRPTKSARCCSGRVTRVADFGAFVELEPGIEGARARVDVPAHGPTDGWKAQVPPG